MDLDNLELTEDDLRLLDADEKKNTENSPDNNVVLMRMQPIEDNAETIQNFDEADLKHFFDDDDDFGMQPIEDNAETVQTFDEADLEHFFDDDDDFGMQPIEDNAETIQTADGVGLTQFFEYDGQPELEDLECLKKFRHQSFRKKQWEIIKSLRDGRDVCAVMATGYGKSLCFQFPAVRSKKITLVVSPLISLMEAQVVDLTKIGISACFVGSAQYDTSILYKIERGHFTIIYCSPEYLQGSNGPRLLSILRNKLALIAVDEAHCLSQWGHDFRPDFRKLNILRQKFPATPILAVTATATENVRYDIATLLRLNEPRVILTSFDRPNLELIIKRKTTVMADLLPLIRDVDGSIIVYVLRRVDAEDVANELIYNGVICMPYHGGQEKPRRSEVLRKFMNDESKVIVATIAFGMGIDKKDVRLVIHYGASKNLEGYYQEVGRAGRDGKASKVITFFSPDDFELHDWFLDQESKKSHLTAVIKNYLRSLGAKMRDFLYTTKCRRKIILDYFGENASLTPRPNCCDNCTMGLGSWRLTDLYEDIDDDGIYDFSAEAKILLDAIKCLKLNGISTEKKLLKQFLIGQYDRRLQKVRRHRCYESGSSHPQHYWLALSEQLSQNGYIDAISDEPQLTLTQKAENWLQNGGSLRLKAIGQMFEYFDRKRSTPLVVGQATMNRHNVTRAVTDLMRKDYVLSDELLKQILSEVRDAVYVLSANILDKNSIATMGDMEKMVKARPKNLDEFRFAMKGTFSEEKVNKFGPTFVNAVSRFTSAQLEMQNVLLNNPMPDINMNRVVSPQIFHLIKDRKSKDEIIELTNLTERQLFDDIATLIQTGQPIQKTDIAYMSHIDFKVLSGLISNTTTNITTVEQVDEITTKYVQTTSEPMDSGFVRLGLMYYAVRFHLNRLSVPYVDCEQNVLVNAEKLIAEERSETLNTDFRTDRQYAPYRTNYYGAGGSIVEFLFGGFMGGHFSYGDVYDAHDYEGYEHYYGGDSSAESYGSDYGNEEEQEEASEQGREEASEQEREEASEQERDEVSAQERDEANAQERNEASAQERDEASEQERDEEDNEASDRENDQESVDSFIVSDESSVIEDEEESGTDTEDSYTDVSDTEDDSDDDDSSDSDFDYESARRNYGQKRRRV